MTRVTFLGHSGFLVETKTQLLLFDWWTGALPALPDRPLTVFVSHRHPDHFDPRIFSLADGVRDVRFVLAKDVRLSDRNRAKWGVSPQTAERCVRVGGNETLELPGVRVETLPSTDEGVAFVITCDGRTIYHAGDLNWWHWDGEAEAWNRNMEVNFKRFLAPLRGRSIDLAFAPLDSRLGGACDWGFRWLMETADVRRIFPMHQWEDFSPTARLRAAEPEMAERIVPVEAAGQHWEFPD